jgi:two-component system, OmpR family, sensor histidine kinase NblS
MRWNSAENTLLLGAVGLITLALLACGLGLAGEVTRHWQQQAMQQQQSQVNQLALGVAHQLTQPSNPGLKLKQLLTQTLHQNNQLLQVMVTDTHGRSLARLNREGNDLTGHVPAADRLTLVSPIPSTQNVKAITGNLTLVFDQRPAQQALTSLQALIWLAIAGLWLVCCGLVVAYTVVLNRHLDKLVAVVKQLGTGEFGITVDEHGLWGQVQSLARAFNDMSMRLKLYQDHSIDSLRQEKNKLQQVLLSIADGVIVCNPDGTATLVNDAAVQMLGLKHYSTLMNSNLADYMTVSGDKPFEACLKAFHQQDQLDILTQTMPLMSTNLRVITSPMLNGQGTLAGMVLIMHDVTREVEIDKLKTSFIANVSHELRTPVTTIKTYVDTLCQHGKDLDTDTYAEFMDTLNVETDRLKRLVNDVLDVARLQEGVQLPRSAEEVGPIVQLTVQSMKVLAQQKQLTISTNIETNMPKVLINADSIERVVRNLLSNAIKYTQPGGRIRCKAELASNGQQIEVTVEDNGMGISAEHLPHIFDRFYRVENRVHTVKGTGLGLHLVKMTIEDYHQGEVFVRSQPEEGSIFGFRLPVLTEAPVNPNQPIGNGERLINR